MNEQFSMFESGTPLHIADKPMRLIELFGGIGAQAKALERLEKRGLLPFGLERYRLVEWDKFCIQSYNAIHHTDFVPLDIQKIHGKDLGVVETDKYNYILTYSFPCQDLSLAGKQRGMEKGTGTRSGLLWEVERLLLEMDELPQIMLMENVPQVHGKKNIEDFAKWISFLSSMGYTSAWKDINAKDMGVPQNRNRTFMVSWQGEHTYSFPEPIELTLRLKDVLEEQVDEKYYLSDKIVQKLVAQMGDKENP